MVLAERESQLQQLHALLGATTRGEGAIVVVSGAAGSGRTALLESFARMAVGSNARFLYAVGSRAERTLPLGVIDQLFRSARPTREPDARISDLLDEASMIVTLHAPDPDSVEQAVAPILRQLCAQILALAEDRTLVIAVDDAHHIDVTSLQCLLYLARRTNSAQVLIILTDRDQPRQVHPVFSSDILRQPHCHRIRLPLLSRQGVAAILVDRLGETASSLADECWYISGGNPLLVNGLVQDQANPVGAGPEQLSVCAAFAEAVMSCLYRCESTVLVAARKLAILGSPTTPGSVFDMDPDTAAKAVATLEATGLLDGNGFRHSAVRIAVLDGLTPDELAALHQQAAQFLHESGAPAVAVAEHLVQAGSGSGDWCAGVLKEAGESALRGGDQHSALIFLRLAEQLCPDDRQRETIRTLVATAEWQVDPAVAARRMPHLMSALRGGVLSNTQKAQLAIQLMWAGQMDEANEAIERLSSNHDDPDLESLQAISKAQCALSLMYPARFDNLLRKQLVGAHDQAADASTPSLLTIASGVGTASDSDDQVRNAERLLLQVRGDRFTMSNAVAISTLICHDRLDLAAYWCDQLLAASSERSRLSRAVLTVAKAWVAGRRGDLRGMAQNARAGLAMMPVTSWGVAVGFPIAVLVTAHTEMGNLEDAIGLLSVNVPPRLFETPFGLLYLRARGRCQLANGRPASALIDFMQCGELMTEWKVDLPSVIPWRSDAAAALLRLDQSERARQLAQDELVLAGHAPRARGVALRAFAAASRPQERVTLLRESIELLQSCGDWGELTLAYADLRQSYQATDQWPHAGATVRRTEQFARDFGNALPLLDANSTATVGEVNHPGAAHPDQSRGREAAELSDAERRVAELAAVGHTNRQIATTLFLTVSTVEQHLTRIYRKLGITRRSDLPVQFKHGEMR